MTSVMPGGGVNVGAGVGAPAEASGFFSDLHEAKGVEMNASSRSASRHLIKYMCEGFGV